MSASTEHTVVVSFIGDCGEELFLPVSRGIQRVFGCGVKRMPLLTDVDFALDPNRDQYHSTLILDKLAEAAPEGAAKVLAITAVDLFIPILTHVYGEAQLGGKTCIVSTFRLKEGLSPLSAQDTYQVRLVKEAIHELGHTFNLRHCQDPACIMHYCRSVRDVDRKSDQMCRYCKVLFDDEMKRLAKQASSA
ncbi:MAG: archaemetzincin family Zn-dependent metalloprotease [Thermodesulfobacteriota bacterium]